MHSLSGGVGIPARGESVRNIYKCQSPLCVECGNFQRWAGPGKRAKDKMRLLELGIRHHLPTGYDLEYVFVTLTPPQGRKSALWYAAATEGNEKAAQALEALSHGAPRWETARNPGGGIYHLLWGEKNRETEHQMHKRASKCLMKLSVDVIESVLTEHLHLPAAGRHLGCIAAYQPLSTRGFYPHLHVLVPCAARYRDPNNPDEWIWRKFSAQDILDAWIKLEQEWRRRVYALMGEDSPPIPERDDATHQPYVLDANGWPCAHTRDLYQTSELRPPSSSTRYSPHRLLEGTHMEKGKRLCVHVRPVERKSSYHELEAAINYLVTDPLAHIYGEFRADPKKVTGNPRLGQAVKSYLRLVRMYPQHGAYIRSYGYMSASQAFPALFALTNLRSAAQWTGRAKSGKLVAWIELLRGLRIYFCGLTPLREGTRPPGWGSRIGRVRDPEAWPPPEEGG